VDTCMRDMSACMCVFLWANLCDNAPMYVCTGM